jgi:hypothetical protein
VPTIACFGPDADLPYGDTNSMISNNLPNAYIEKSNTARSTTASKNLNSRFRAAPSVEHAHQGSQLSSVVRIRNKLRDEKEKAPNAATHCNCYILNRHAAVMALPPRLRRTEIDAVSVAFSSR